MLSLFRSGLFAGLFMLLTACAGSGPETTESSDPPESGSVLKRKNIDDLTAAELAAYEHAVEMMKKKSLANPFDRTGFTWQAWVHNCTNIWASANRELDPAHEDANRACGFFQPKPADTYHMEHPGMCEHGKDIFLPWHRAEFYFYEKALQASDPNGLEGPATEDVTVPYWNFTKRPSGSRYPLAFENQSSPLYHERRNHDALTTPYAFTSPYLLAYQIYYMDWEDFGGYEVGAAGNYGAFEAQIHNPMHGTYVGGDLGGTSTAALDPLFFSFHAYIDYIFEAWIEEHSAAAVTSKRQFMRAQQDKGLPLPPDFSEGTGTAPPGNGTMNMGRAEIYFDLAKLGYEYQPGPDGEFIPKPEIEALVAKHKQAGFNFGSSEISLFSALLSYGDYGPSPQPGATFQGALTIPNTVPPATKYLLEIVRPASADDYTFQADVYIHPANVEADIGNAEFRHKYLAVSTAYWALGEQHSTTPSSTRLTSNITAVIESLVAGGKGGEDWQVSLAIKAEPGHDLNFENPTVTIN